MKAETTSRFHSVTSAASRQRSARRRSMSSSRRSMRVGCSMGRSVRDRSDSIEFPQMGRIRVGLAGIPVRDDPQRAIEILLERGYDACEIDFEGGFWMDYPWAEQLGAA